MLTLVSFILHNVTWTRKSTRYSLMWIHKRIWVNVYIVFHSSCNSFKYKITYWSPVATVDKPKYICNSPWVCRTLGGKRLVLYTLLEILNYTQLPYSSVTNFKVIFIIICNISGTFFCILSLIVT